jgi:hypothetical protein
MVRIARGHGGVSYWLLRKRTTRDRTSFSQIMHCNPFGNFTSKCALATLAELAWMKGAHFDTLLPTLGNIVAYHLNFAHIFLFAV